MKLESSVNFASRFSGGISFPDNSSVGATTCSTGGYNLKGNEYLGVDVQNIINLVTNHIFRQVLLTKNRSQCKASKQIES